MNQYVTLQEAYGVLPDLPAVWVSGTEYEQGAQVTYQNDIYSCIQAHTATPDLTPNTATGYWTVIDSSSFKRLIWIASMMIDQMTFHRIGRWGRDPTPWQEEHIKHAVLEQIKFNAENGLDEQAWAPAGAVSSWSVTDVSMGYNRASAEISAESDWLAENGYAPLAYMYLKQTGLTWRGAY